MAIKIETQLGLKSYSRLIYILYFKSYWGIIYSIFVLLYLSWSIVFSIQYGFAGTFSNFICLIILIIYPILMLNYRIKKHYNSNKRASEKTIYELSEKNYKVTGETYKTEYLWDHTYKILEQKDWILIYQNYIMTEIIDKSFFTSEQLEEFKQMIPRDKGIIIKLKKNK